MATYSFKSSGILKSNKDTNSVVSTAILPIGIKTPLSLGENDIFTTNSDIITQLGDNLKNLIMTNWGERLCLYKFGGNLKPLLTENISQDDFDTQAIDRIRTAVQTWMPYIDLQDFASEILRKQPNHAAVVVLTVAYDIPSLNAFNKRISVTLYAM